MKKVDWLAAGASSRVSGVLSIISKFSLPLAYRLQNPLANGKRGLVPEEMSQSLLTNKKQGKSY